MPMSNTSYIRLNRKILDWEWYGDINTCRLFIHMLLKANWKDGEFKGKHIPRGSFVSSFGKLAEETQLTVDEVRTAVKHLISTKEITKQAYSKFTVFTVKNYDAYQFVPSNCPNESQAIPERFPTKEEYKEGNNKKEEPKGSKKKFDPPTVDEVRAYCQERGNKVDPQAFCDFYEAKGWMVGKNHMKDWQAAVRTWEKSSSQSKGAPAQKRYDANKGMMRADYGDMAEYEKALLAN